MDKKDVLLNIEEELNRHASNYAKNVDIDDDVIDTDGADFNVVTEAMRRADAADFGFHTQNFNDTIDAEAMALSSQMRHRATMMRQRADEFDEIADKMVAQARGNIQMNNSFRTAAEEVRTILQLHAHIKPTQVR